MRRYNLFLPFLIFFSFFSIYSCQEYDPSEIPYDMVTVFKYPKNAFLGKTFNLTCVTKIPRGVKFQMWWTNLNDKENIKFYNSTSLYDQLRGLVKETVVVITLIFTKLKKSHAGKYECDLGSPRLHEYFVRKTFVLEVLEELIIPSTDKALLGLPFNLTCIARVEAFRKFKFYWVNENDGENVKMHNSTTIQQQLNGLKRGSIVETTLVFSKVKKTHQGTYYCALMYFQEEVMYKNTTTLEILDKVPKPLPHEPSSKDPYFWEAIGKGTDNYITCYGVMEVEWMKMATPPVDPYSKQELVPVKAEQDLLYLSAYKPYPYLAYLSLYNMQPQESGNYTCVYKAARFIGIDFWEKEKHSLLQNLYIFVGDPNELYVKTPNVIMEKRGFPLTIPCRPTYVGADVLLFKTDDESLIYPQNFETPVSFSPTDGFTLPMTGPYKTTSGYFCVFKYENYRQTVYFEVLSEPTLTYNDVRPTLLGFKPNPEINEKRTLYCHMPFLKEKPSQMEWKFDVKKSDNFEISPMIVMKYKFYSVAEIQLEINKVSDAVKGKYNCVVRGINGLFSHSEMELNVKNRTEKPDPIDEKHFPKNSVIITSSNKVLLGKPFNLTCIARVEAHREFRFFWINENDEENIKMYNSSTLEQQRNGMEKDSIVKTTLVFSEIKKTHKGNYHCVFISFQNGKLFKNRITLEVFERFKAPKFNPEANWNVVRKNENLILSCRGNAEVEWMKMTTPPVDSYSKQELIPVRGEQHVEFNEHEHYSYSATLTIKNLQPQETGNYTCVYKSGLSMDIDLWEKEKYHLFRNIYVYVGDLHELYVKTPNVIMKNDGFPLTVPCRPTFPETEVFLYNRDDETLMYPRAFDNRVKFRRTDGFTIPMIEPYTTKSGYFCVFKYEGFSQIVYFDVLAEPTLTHYVNPTLLGFKPNPEINKPATLFCLMPFLKEKPVKMEWKLSVGETNDLQMLPMTVKNHGNYSVAEIQLKINKVTDEAKGKFVCAVYGKNGLYSESAMNLDVKYQRKKPNLSVKKIKKSTYYTVPNGGSITLICSGTAPTVWKKTWMDEPKYSVKKNLENFYRKDKNQPLLPISKIGDADVPIDRFKRYYSFIPEQENPYISWLALSNLTGDDAGLYVCRYADTYNYEITDVDNFDDAFIYVNGASKLYVSTVTEITGIQNDPILIPCIPTDLSVSVDLYYADFKSGTRGSKVPKELYIYQAGTGFILRHLKNEEKLRKYYCSFRRDGKEKNVVYSVDSIPRPFDLKHPEIIYPKERTMLNSIITYGCLVKTAYPNHPITINFIRPGKNLTADTRIHIKKDESIDNGELVIRIAMTIKHLKAEDEGNYECEVVDFFGRVRTVNYFMEVFDSMLLPPILTNVVQLNYDSTDRVKFSKGVLRISCSYDMETKWFNETVRPKGDVTFEIEHFLKFQKPPLWTLQPVIKNNGANEMTPADDTTSTVKNGSDLIFGRLLDFYYFSWKDVGYYVCVNKYDVDLKNKDTETMLKEKRLSRVYMFSDGDDILHADTQKDLLFKKDTKSLVIPCRPSGEDVVVELHDKDDKIIPLDEIPFSQIEGFTLPKKYLEPTLNIFQCVYKARRNDRDITQREVIKATYIPEHIENPKIEAEPFEHNKRFDIICTTQVKLNSVVRIQWYKYPTMSNKPDPNIKIQTSTTHILANGTKEIQTILKIFKVNARHQGLFMCKVEDIYGNVKIATREFKIYEKTYSPPKITPSNKDLVINNGDNLLLECEGDFPVMWKVHSIKDRPYGDVTKKVEAFKKNQMLKTDDTGLNPPAWGTLIEEKGNKTFLRINNVHTIHAGFYTCVYKDKMDQLGVLDLEKSGRASRIYVYIKFAYNIYKPISDKKIIYEENTIFTIPCIPMSKEVNVELYNDDDHIPKNHSYVEFDPRTGFTIFSDSIFKINRPIKCSFRTNISDTQIIEFFLERIPKDYEITNVKVYRFDENIAICNTKLDRRVPYFISWRYPNKDAEKRAVVETNCTETKFYRECQSKVTVKKFSFKDTGFYICVRTDTFSRTKSELFALFGMHDNTRVGWKLLFQDGNFKGFCGKSSVKEKNLKHKNPAKLGQFPWMARVGFPVSPWSQEIQYICSGSLLGSNFILTAARCTFLDAPDNGHRPLPVVKLGTLRIDESEYFDNPRRYQEINAVSIIKHPSFKEPGGLNDIGIILLEHQALLNYQVFPICLPRGTLNVRMYSNERYELAGWGLLASDPETSMSDVLRQDFIFPEKSCSGLRPKGFCVKGENVPCYGDTGIPIMWKPEKMTLKNYFMAGLVTKDVGDKCNKKIATVANISYHIEFILSGMEMLYGNYYKVKP